MTVVALPANSQQCEQDEVLLLGHIEPRLWTPPLRELTPETSYGYDVIEFARDILGIPLDPWQQWLAIHAGELLPDGRPRFRKVLVLVARQNGKTTLLRVLKLYWLFVEQWECILGTSTDRNYAKKDWRKVCDMATANPALVELLPKHKNKGVITQMGEERLVTASGCEYSFAANNGRAGRSLSIDRLVIDELREHKDWECWKAATGAMNARPYGQVFAITNQGDDTAIVLDSLREDALRFIKTGEGDRRLGLFEWSAPDGADVMNEDGWAWANPNLGYRLTKEDIEGDAIRAKQNGGKVETGFRTEILCQRVRALDGAVDPLLWAECFVPGDLAQLRSRVAVVADLSIDRQHATLVAAAVLEDGRVRVEEIGAWQNDADGTATQKLRKALPTLLAKVQPQAFGWIPNGPAAALMADLADRKTNTAWPPRGITVHEIRGEVSAVCMGFAEQVAAKQIVHSDQPLLTTHILGAAKLWNGDTWRFSRKGEGQCDAAYAAAGAVYLARTLPPPRGKLQLVTAAG